MHVLNSVPTSVPTTAPLPANSFAVSSVEGSGADAGAGAETAKATVIDKDGIGAASGSFFSFSATSLLQGLIRSTNDAIDKCSSSELSGVAPVQSQDAKVFNASGPYSRQEGSHDAKVFNASGPYSRQASPMQSDAGLTEHSSMPTASRMLFGSSETSSLEPSLRSAALDVSYASTRSVVSSTQGNMTAVEQRVSQVEEKLKGIDTLVQGRQDESNSLAELEVQVQLLAMQLAEVKSSRKSLEDRATRIRAQVRMEREEREAWVKAFNEALAKSLFDLNTCIDQGVAESSKAMMARLESADSMMMKLINRVDEIQLARENASKIPSNAKVEAISPTVKEIGREPMQMIRQTSPRSEDPVQMMLSGIMNGQQSGSRAQPAARLTTLSEEAQTREQISRAGAEAEDSGSLEVSGNHSASSSQLLPTEPNMPLPTENAQLLQDWTEVFNENIRLQQLRSGLIHQRRKQQRAGITSKSVGHSVGASNTTTPDCPTPQSTVSMPTGRGVLQPSAMSQKIEKIMGSPIGVGSDRVTRASPDDITKPSFQASVRPSQSPMRTPSSMSRASPDNSTREILQASTRPSQSPIRAPSSVSNARRSPQLGGRVIPTLSREASVNRQNP